MNPFLNILRLSTGDILARGAAFCVYIYLARVLGVESYGALEFAISVVAYFLLLGDAGLELWGTQSVAQGRDVADLVPRILTLRLLLAALAVFGLAAFAFRLPIFPGLRPLLLLYGLLLVIQAFDLRWVLMGTESLGGVARGLVVGQIAFAVLTVVVVREPSQVLYVPLCQAAGHAVMGLYWLRRARPRLEQVAWRPRLAGAREILVPSLTLGTSRAVALLSYNFDSLLLGLVLGVSAVAWYSAAYRPLSVFLAVSTTYFLGLFPVLSRTFAAGTGEFEVLVRRSLSLASAVAVPIAVGARYFSEPVIDLLYGGAYLDAAAVAEILGWSVALVMLRGTFRQALCAAGLQGPDLRGAIAAGAINVALNLVLIPRAGVVGAAFATVASEVVWLLYAVRVYEKRVGPVPLLGAVAAPLVGGAAMVVAVECSEGLPWPVALPGAVLAYVGTLLVARRARRAWRGF